MKGRTNAGSESSLQIPLDAPTDLTATAGNARVSLTWTDPKDKYATPEGEQAQDPQQLVSKWAYTKIVRKVGSAPTGPNDGVAVVSSEVRNAYQTEPFVDTGVENDVTYYYAAYAYNEAYIASNGTVSGKVTPKDVMIYGVEWNGTDTTKWTRIGASKDFQDPVAATLLEEGSSPFDELMPWAGMTVSEDPNAGAVVSIPKFWFKWTELNPGLRLEIATGPWEGFMVSPAHMDRGDGKGERDKVYVGKYFCALDTYKSTSGAKVQTYVSGNQFENQIPETLGESCHLIDNATLWSISMLYLVEFADWDSQKAIGKGCLKREEVNLISTGGTDIIAYHTGTNQESRENLGRAKYRNIESLWDSFYCRFAGLMYIAYNMYGTVNPSKFASKDEEWINLGSNNSKKYGYVTKLKVCDIPGFEWMLIPTEYDGSSTTYLPDKVTMYGDHTGIQYAPFLGSASYQDLGNYGLFYRGQTRNYSSSNDKNMASRLMVLPNPEVTA